MTAEIIYNSDNIQFFAWVLGVGLLICINLIIFLGLKFPWFRNRLKFNTSSYDKDEPVIGVGFKQVISSEFGSYKYVSEFSTPTNTLQGHGRQKGSKKQTNPEVALKVRTMLNRSQSNATTTQNVSINNADNSTESVLYHNENQNTIQNWTFDNNEMKTTPRSILKKPNTAVNMHEDTRKESTENEIYDEDEHETISRNGYRSSTESFWSTQDSEIITDNNHNTNNLADEEILPEINYATIPKKDPITAKKQWDKLCGSDEELEHEIKLNNKSQHTTLILNDSDDNDKPYVIEIKEGKNKTENMYAEVQNGRKLKKSISFEDNVATTIDDEDDGLYNDIIETLHERQMNRSSESSNKSSSEDLHTESEDEKEKDLYGNDYTNTKRTSYFQAGNSTYSSQAASIFFGNKKPVAERRPTKRYISDMPVDSQSNA